jgi:murein DD-endopeptidase MepM/ murein hydrolase activator NlpD
MRTIRARTADARQRVAEETRAVEARAAEQRAERDRLLVAERQLEDARGEKERTLAAVRTSRDEYLHEAAGLAAQSAALAEQIRSAQAASSVTYGPSDSTPSVAGLLWPVSGYVTSGFGWRWGRMHEGVDIGASGGAPIQASAGGSVIYAGWMGGYGNLVVVDHGNGVATAYAHMSALGVGVGQAVAPGQTLGYVGCTGHCFGDHLHFEVRVNGAPYDPLGYL